MLHSKNLFDYGNALKNAKCTIPHNKNDCDTECYIIATYQ